MTHEEMQRTMEFIVQQQAQFAANIQLLQENHGSRISRLEDSFKTVVELLQISESRLDRLESRNTTLESKSELLESKMAKLADAQAHADERLSALIDIVRRQQNGKSN